VIYAFLPPPDMGTPSTGAGSGATESVVSSMEAAKLDEAAFKKLSTSFEKLNDTAKHLGDLADMAKSSKDFTNNTKDAAIALGTVKDSVASVANNLGSFASASDGVKNLNEQFVTMTKTMEAMNNYYGKLSEASNAMSSSAADAVRAKEQIALLADNLTKLNARTLIKVVNNNFIFKTSIDVITQGAEAEDDQHYVFGVDCIIGIKCI
jgi:uncharacterized phage infection (PIP) family protein YhgE